MGLESPAGVRVSNVCEGSPASASGIVQNDIVVAMAGSPVRSVDQFHSLVDGSTPRSDVELVVYRDGMEFETSATIDAEVQTVTVGGFQRLLPIYDHKARSGMVVVELISEVRPFVLGPYQGDSGLMIVDLHPGGPAFQSHLRIGDILTRVAEKPVQPSQEFQEAVADARPGDSVPLTIWRQHETVNATVRIEEDALRETNLRAIVVSYCGSAARTSFSLVGNLLFKYFDRNGIDRTASGIRHWTESGWSFVLSLIEFRQTPEQSKLQLAWIIPIWFRED